MGRRLGWSKSRGVDVRFGQSGFTNTPVTLLDFFVDGSIGLLTVKNGLGDRGKSYLSG